jgi:hypothetical protein
MLLRLSPPVSLLNLFLSAIKREARLSLSYVALLDVKSFHASGIPSVFVFDKNGRLASVVYPEDMSEALIQTVLDGQIPKVKQEKAWGDPVGAEKYFRALRAEAVKKEQEVHH